MSQNESSKHPIFVLLVDDEPSQLEITQLGLQNEDVNLTVTTTSSAKQALEQIRAKPFDCIVSDYVMPNMNGLELCAELRGEGITTPFILFTGQGSEEVAQQAFGIGVDDYLRKEQSLAIYSVLVRNIRNLVEKRRAEEEAMLTKMQLDSAFLNSPVVAFGQDLNLRYTWIYNPNMSIVREQTIGKTDEELIGSQGEQLTRAKRRVMETGVGERVEFELAGEGGSFVYDTTIEPTRDYSGRITGIVCTAVDITDRRRVEKAHREIEEKYRRIVESAHDGILVSDLDGRISFANKRMGEMLGYSVDELVGKPGIELASTSDHAKAEEMSERRRAGASDYYEIWMTRKDGDEVCMLASGSPMHDSEGRHIGNQDVYSDITDMKRMEEALRESEKRYRQIVENTTVAIYEISLNGDKFISVNDATTRILGYSREELLAMSPTSFGDDKSRAAFAERVRKKLAGELIDTTVQYTAVAKDGSKHTVLLNDVEFMDRTGQPESVVVIATDITDRVRAEEALRESEERFRVLSQTSPVGVGVSSAEGVLLYTNPAYESILGYDSGELLGIKASDLYMYPEERASWFEKMGRGEAIKDFELKLKRKHGSLVWVAINTSNIQYGGKRAVIGIIQDISARKRAEEQLRVAREALQEYTNHLQEMVESKTREMRESEERLSAFSNSAPVLLYTYDRELNLLDINNAGLSVFPEGTRKQDVVGRNLRELTPGVEDTERFRVYMQVLNDGAPRSIESVSYDGGGIGRAFDIRVFRVGDGIGTVAVDVTERGRLDESLRDAQRGADIDKVSAMVAHDIKSPINTASQALRMARCDPAKAEHFIGMAEKSLGRAAEMIEALRENTRMIEPKPREVNLRLLVEDTIREMPTRENVFVESSFGEGVDVIRVDPGLTRRVLENLLVNAGEAMPSGGRVRVRAWRDGRDLVLSLADSGVGISEDVAGKVFTPMFTTKTKGVGLGLSFCKRAVEAQGGTIDFSSRVGEGTTFTIKIPID